MMQAPGGMPIMVLKEGTRREEGRSALEQNIGAGTAIAKTVRTTLGPKGMDKMLVDSAGDTIITNDGVTILKEIDVEHPAAKMVVEAAKTQDDECGDGTTTAVIITGELLEQALPLVRKNIHTTVIIDGYNLALQEALDVVEEMQISIGIDLSIVETREQLRQIAITSMTGKHTEEYKYALADYAVSILEAIAVQGLEGRPKIDLDNCKVVKERGKSVDESEIIPGVIVNRPRASKAMPTQVHGGKIALFSCPIGVKKTGLESSIQIENAEDLKSMLAHEAGEIEEVVRILDNADIKAVFTTKGIDDDAVGSLEELGILAVSRIMDIDMDRISKIVKAPILSKIHTIETSPAYIGRADLIEEKTIEGDPQTIIKNWTDDHGVRTLHLRGASAHVMDEIERGFHDALATSGKAYEDGYLLPGGGAVFAEIARRLYLQKVDIAGRESYAVEAFAKAAESIPNTLAENAGLDPITSEISLRKAHSDGISKAGVNVTTGAIEDMSAQVVEPKRVVTQALKSAVETASMILRIDDIIAMKGGEAAPGGPLPGYPGA